MKLQRSYRPTAFLTANIWKLKATALRIVHVIITKSDSSLRDSTASDTSNFLKSSFLRASTSHSSQCTIIVAVLLHFPSDKVTKRWWIGKGESKWKAPYVTASARVEGHENSGIKFEKNLVECAKPFEMLSEKKEVGWSAERWTLFSKRSTPLFASYICTWNLKLPLQ